MTTLTARPAPAGGPVPAAPAPHAPPSLSMLGAELGSVAVLAGAARRLDGPELAMAVALAGLVMAVGRASALRLPPAPLSRSAGAVVPSAIVLLVGLCCAAVPALQVPAAALGLGAAHLVSRFRGRDPLAVPPRPGAGLALAGPLLVLLAVLAVAPGSPDAGLLASLAILGLPPLVVTSLGPALVLARQRQEGRRDTVVPALLFGAGLGAVCAVLVTAAPAVLVGAADERLTRHAPNFAMAAILLGLCHVLVRHSVAAGRVRTPLVHLGLAAVVAAGMLLGATGTDAAVAVNAVLGGAVVLFTGLAVAGVVSAPFAVPSRVEGDPDTRVRVAPLLGAFTFAAVVVRLVSARELWLDEAATARSASGASLGSVLEAARGSDPHPPLHLVLTWASRRLLGDSTLALRLPSLVAGTLLILLLYLVGKELYGRRVGLVAAGVGALAPALVWFSTEARPPVLAACLGTLALLAMLRAVRRGGAGDWLAFGVAGAALVWSHQLAWIHVAVLFAAAAFAVFSRTGGDRRRGAVGWAGAAAIVVLAGVALMAQRSGIGPPPALPPFEYATRAAPGEGSSLFPVIGSGVSALVGLHPPDVTSRLLALWPLGILLSLVVLGRARSRRGVLLVALAAAPFVALFAAQVLGVPRHPAFALGWAATAVPMVTLLVARALDVFGGSWRRVRFLAVGLAAVLALALVDQSVRVQPVPRYDVGPVVAEVAARAEAGDAVVFEPRALRDLVRHEVDDGVTVLSLAAAEKEGLEDHRRVFVVAAFALSTRPESGDRVVSLVKDLSADRRPVLERGRPDVKMWEFM